MNKRKVVIGFVGTQLDSGKGAGRWDKWRPSVALTQREDFVVDRFELLCNPPHAAIAEQVIHDIRSVSPETDVRFHEVPMSDAWDFENVYAAIFDFVKTYEFDTDNEEYLVHITTGTHVVQICLFLLTETRFIPGLILQTSPPRKQVAGSVGSYNVIDLDMSRYNQIAQRHQLERSEGLVLLKSGIGTRNPHFNEMISEIETVAVKSRSPMLLMGPTGAGKSFLARRIFELKKARHQLTGKFVEINCATLRGDGAGSTLFGHVRGAFTGAASERAGLLRMANGGIVFLDEIGDLGLNDQSMLLTAIEEKRFFPMGGDQIVKSDFMLLSGTNRDLRKEVAEGRFREDLFARINTWSYSLPGLQERKEDIEPNIEYLLAVLGSENNESVRFNKEAHAKYMDFAMSHDASWSANFRDLSASITRMTTLADAGRITVAVVDKEISRLKNAWSVNFPKETTKVDLESIIGASVDHLDMFDRLQLESVIMVCQRSKTLSDAGRKLFAVSRQAKEKPNDSDRLKKFLAKFGLTWENVSGVV